MYLCMNKNLSKILGVAFKMSKIKARYVFVIKLYLSNYVTLILVNFLIFTSCPSEYQLMPLKLVK